MTEPTLYKQASLKAKEVNVTKGLLRNKVYKWSCPRYSVAGDYTAMATKAKVPEIERYWLRVLGPLNEAQARVFVAQKALEEGRGAVRRLARLTSMSRPY